MIPTLYLSSAAVVAGRLDEAEACLAGGLLADARALNLEPGEYFARRQRTQLQAEILRWTQQRGARAYRIQSVPLTRPRAISEACQAYASQNARFFVEIEAGFSGSVYNLELHRRAAGPGGVVAEIETDGVLTWLIADPGPLFQELGCNPVQQVGDRRCLSIESLKPIACDYALEPSERQWLEQRLGQSNPGAGYTVYVELLSPAAYAQRAAIVELARQALTSGRIQAREVRPGVVFAALPSALMEAHETYQIGAERIGGRELLKSLKGSEPDPLLCPLVDLLAAAELGESLPLGAANHYNESGAVSVQAEAEVKLEPEAALFLESQLKDSPEVAEWLVGVSTFAGIFAGGAILAWPEAQELRESLQNREVLVLGLLDRHVFHRLLGDKLFAHGWSCLRQRDEQSWEGESVQAWRDEPELQAWSFAVHPVRAYVELLFHGRELEQIIDARVQLLEAELAARR